MCLGSHGSGQGQNRQRKEGKADALLGANSSCTWLHSPPCVLFGPESSGEGEGQKPSPNPHPHPHPHPNPNPNSNPNLNLFGPERRVRP